MASILLEEIKKAQSKAPKLHIPKFPKQKNHWDDLNVATLCGWYCSPHAILPEYPSDYQLNRVCTVCNNAISANPRHIINDSSPNRTLCKRKVTDKIRIQKLFPEFDSRTRMCRLCVRAKDALKSN